MPSSSVLLYANPITISGSSSISGSYVFSGSFSFDFWINPKYTTDNPTDSFKTGTIFHLSSCYAVSLVTGSSRDVNGYSNKFRVLLQLSSSTDTAPSLVNTSSLGQFMYLSDDNSLIRNTWQHVTVRWSNNSYNLGSGSFIVDGTAVGTFVIPSSSVTPSSFLPTRDNPNVLCVGNYYEGPNSGSSVLSYFFSTDTATREGLEELVSDVGFSPTNFTFDHPLNAEVHDLKIYNKHLTNAEIAALRTSGPPDRTNLLFYLPPFFTRESPTRQYYNGDGGVFESPFFTVTGSTTTPFTATMAWAVGGHYINLENFTRELIANRHPRLWELSGSVIGDTTSIPQSANQLLYATGSVRKRNATVLPCDNGVFYPAFTRFLGSLSQSLFVNDLGNSEPGTISLRNLISTASLFPGIRQDTTSSLIAGLTGPDPSVSSSLTLSPGRAPTILQRTRDNSSNQIALFDISNLYYGMYIKPGTLEIIDTALSGTNSKVKIALKDDGHGNVYRADSTGSHASWNSVGNVFYNEGVVLIKSPHLYFFGEEQYTMTFKGEQNVHVLKFNLVAYPHQQISSSNPSYTPVSASDMANDADKRFVYVTGINLHDDNLNLIAKTSLAQPLVVRSSDMISFRPKFDF